MNLVKLAIEKQMGPEQVMKLLEIANNDLPSVESEYENLKKEIDLLEYKKNVASNDYRLICDYNSNLQKERDQLQLIVEQLRHDQAKLNQ